jgi:hypothetical protein
MKSILGKHSFTKSSSIIQIKTIMVANYFCFQRVKARRIQIIATLMGRLLVAELPNIIVCQSPLNISRLVKQQN